MASSGFALCYGIIVFPQNSHVDVLTAPVPLKAVVLGARSSQRELRLNEFMRVGPNRIGVLQKRKRHQRSLSHSVGEKAM